MGGITEEKNFFVRISWIWTKMTFLKRKSNQIFHGKLIFMNQQWEWYCSIPNDFSYYLHCLTVRKLVHFVVTTSNLDGIRHTIALLNEKESFCCNLSMNLSPSRNPLVYIFYKNSQFYDNRRNCRMYALSGCRMYSYITTVFTYWIR